MKLLRQVIKFGKAYAIWIKNGKPVRSDALISLIFNTHCKSCDHYDSELKECSICECPVSEKPDERNKIVYDTESCPIGVWSSEKGVGVGEKDSDPP